MDMGFIVGLGFGGVRRGGYVRKQHALNRLHMLMETVLVREDHNDDRALIDEKFGHEQLNESAAAIERAVMGLDGGKSHTCGKIKWHRQIRA